ncbi:MAG: hypothetical protein N2578_02825 [Bdellovibrionaceae bacterium]|nr:hypothetical protein [Pseudobdellovibrionaceae bacterium]
MMSSQALEKEIQVLDIIRLARGTLVFLEGPESSLRGLCSAAKEYSVFPYTKDIEEARLHLKNPRIEGKILVVEGPFAGSVMEIGTEALKYGFILNELCISRVDGSAVLICSADETRDLPVPQGGQDTSVTLIQRPHRKLLETLNYLEPR